MDVNEHTAIAGRHGLGHVSRNSSEDHKSPGTGKEAPDDELANVCCARQQSSCDHENDSRDSNGDATTVLIGEPADDKHAYKASRLEESINCGLQRQAVGPGRELKILPELG